MTRTSTYAYTSEDIQAMLRHCQEPEHAWLEPIVACLAATGLRPREMAALKWANLDFEHLRIQIEGPPAGAAIATKETARTIPMPQVLAERLKKLPRHADGLVFHDTGSRPVVAHRLLRSLRRDVLIPLAEQQPHFDTPAFRRGNLHGFRHAFFRAGMAGHTLP